MPLIDPYARFRPAPYPGRDQALRILVNREDVPEKGVVLTQVSEQDYSVKVEPMPDNVLFEAKAPIHSALHQA